MKATLKKKYIYLDKKPKKVKVKEDIKQKEIIEKPIDVAETKTAELDEESPEKKNVACVIVPSTGEIIIRYSFKLHGELFADLAIGMAKKKGLEVRFETE